MVKPRNPEKYDEVLSLRIKDRKSTVSISEITGVPYPTVRKWLLHIPLSLEERGLFVGEANKNRLHPNKLSTEERDRRKRERSRQWYNNNSQAQIELVAERRKELAAWLLSSKTGKRCLLCEETHPACLEFHHRNSSTKFTEVSTMVQHGYSKENIENEISKCDLICSNCHRKLHWEEKNNAHVAQANRAQTSEV